MEPLESLAYNFWLNSWGSGLGEGKMDLKGILWGARSELRNSSIETRPEFR